MFKPIKIESRKQVLFNALKDAIFKGQLSPGDPLKEMHLATQFNVSQAVVREALFQLEQVGLITKIPNKGTIVKIISEREIRERIIVRIHLEEFACIDAVQRMQNEDYEELNDYLIQMREAISNEKFLQYTKIDLDFHQYIWKKSDNKILSDTLTQIVTPLFFISFNLQHVQHWVEIIDSVAIHEKYLKSIKSGNKTQIKSTIISHVNDSSGIYQMSNVSLPGG
jgi:DNA-binding GntR family transcriptional regulator